MAREFRVNSYADNFQLNPDMARLPDGGFVVVWNSYFDEFNDGPTANYIALQRYDADGKAVGGEQVIFGRSETSSYNPSITFLSDGGYVVLWEYDDYDSILTLEKHVLAQVHNADGTVRRAAFQVDTVPAFDAVEPEAFATANGGFRVTFGVNRAEVLFDQIYTRLYRAQGVARGPDQLLNTNVGGYDQIYARSAQLTDGRTITIWNSEASLPVPPRELDSNEIRGTLFSASGQVLRGDFHLSRNIGTVGSDNGDGYDVAALSNGGFVISRREFGADLTNDFLTNVLFETFDGTGASTRGPFIAYSSQQVVLVTRVTQMESGEIAVIWEQQPEQQGKFGNDVMGRIFATNGAALTPTFRISVDRFDFDDQTDPELVSLAGGGFAVTYLSDSIDPDFEGIAGRIFGRGTSGADRLGVDQSGTMAGLAGNDTLIGNFRANSLSGGAGLDRLKGGAGADHFVFDKPDGVDRILDFSAVDLIVLDGEGFGDLAPGRLAASAFRLLGSADADDHILYNAGTGALYYDANGSGAGGRVQFASLTPGTALTAADFLVI